MTKDEVLAMADEALCAMVEILLGYSMVPDKGGTMVWIPFKPHTWRPVRDYTHDIAAAWELFEKAKGSACFWDFCDALKALAESDDLTVIMGFLDADTITRAFVMAITKWEEERWENEETSVE